MSSYILAKGSKLYRKNPTSSVYEEVPQCVILNAPSIRQDFDDITNHSSAGGFKEYAATLRDGGELALELLWDLINIPIHATMYDDSVAEPLPVRLWGIILPNGLNGWALPRRSAPALRYEFQEIQLESPEEQQVCPDMRIIEPIEIELDRPRKLL